MTAERFHFTPEDIHVRAGTLVELNIKSLDGTHGFTLNHFGIDESIKEGETKTVRFFAGERGEFGFHCSHFCGIGHFGMTGKVIVE
jgi:heme/copper-type cytochrome/quinol oxidase subunit 2